MSQDDLNDRLKKLAEETTKDNYPKIILKMDELVREYVLITPESNKNELIEQLTIQYHLFDGDEFKEEAIGEILDRLSDYCSPGYRYIWKP